VLTNDNRREELAWAKFLVRQRPDDGEQYLESTYTFVAPRHRGQGLARIMYQYANSLGNDIRPSRLQTDLGRGMWQGLDKTIKQPPELSKSTPVPGKKPGLFNKLKSVFAEGVDFTNAVNSIEKLVRQNNIEFSSYQDLLKFVASRKFLQAQRNDQQFIDDVARSVLRRLQQTQLNEINAPDELTVSEKLQKYFFDRGYSYVGDGQDQMAFKSPRGTIVKVLGTGNADREQAVRDYVEFFQRNQRNPHFPRIYNAGEFIIDDETYFVYETEYLQYVGGSEETLEYLEDLMNAMGRDAVVPFMSNREKPAEISDQELDGLLNATQDIIDALVGPKGYNLDLSQIENIRRRPNGQLVLTDPISVY
jgi:hypothetical protein